MATGDAAIAPLSMVRAMYERSLALRYLVRTAAQWPPPSPTSLMTARSISELREIAASRRIPGFNRQVLRTAYLTWLFSACECSAFAETGTYTGGTAVTARWLFGAPVHTVELKRVYWLARALVLLTRSSGIVQRRGDSRAALSDWLRSGILGRRPMLYLDAHWYADHPLRAEVGLAVERGSCVIVIDDCRVGTDPGFGYDADPRGESFAITADGLRDLLPAGRVTALQPAHYAEDETGQRRGTLIALVDIALPRPREEHAVVASLFERIEL